MSFTGPFPLSEVISRAQQIQGLRLVGNAADLDAALNTPPRAVPALYVLGDEQGGEVLGVTGRTAQNISVTVKLVLWVRNAGGAERLVAEMTALETELRKTFFGWRPASAYQPLTVRASGSEQAYGSHLVRQLLLTTRYRQEAPL